MMLPMPVASVASRRNTPFLEETYFQQFGRSTSSLAAEVAAAALRASEIRRSLKETPSADLSCPGERISKLVGGVDILQLDPLFLQPFFQSPYVPALSLSLKIASPPASLERGETSTGSSSSDNQPSTRAASPTSSTSESSNGVSPTVSPKPTASPPHDSPPQRPPIPPRPRPPPPPAPRWGVKKPLGARNVPHRQCPPTSFRPASLLMSDFGPDYSRYPFLVVKTPHSISTPSQPLPYQNALAPSATKPPVAGSSGEKCTSNLQPKALSRNGTREKPLPPILDDLRGLHKIAEKGYRLPMLLNEKEPDDDLHMPYPDDDKKLKPKFKDYLARDQICSLIGLLLIVLGLMGIFVVLPVLSFNGIVSVGIGSKTASDPGNRDGEAWAFVNNVKYPLLSKIRTGLIDPTTPQSALRRRGVDGDDLHLVFSDEFNGHNRTFYPGDDPFWTAQDLWYGATHDLEWYDPDAATTSDGTLVLQLDKFDNHNLQYRSAMLNSWNQICFKGGALEVSISLAGPAGTPGLWPGAWTMGNLGRPGYQASTEGVWPYTYDSCDAGITPNQSATDGLSGLPGQRLPSCVCPGEDHPTPGKGRGAPEIDVIEASVDPHNKLPLITQSYQVAPFDIWYRPNYDFLEIPNYNTTQMNAYCGGPFQQAISGTTTLNKDWFDGRQYQKYAVEYTPGTGQHSQIAWFVGEDMSYRLTGDAIGPNGNVNSRIVSEEPMSIVLNLGFSQAWTEIDWAHLKFPTTMHVDYVRWYQKAGDHSVTCDPPGYETTEYIKKHPKAYYNQNLTVRISLSECVKAGLTGDRAGIKRAMDGRSTSLTATASTLSTLRFVVRARIAVSQPPHHKSPSFGVLCESSTKHPRRPVYIPTVLDICIIHSMRLVLYRRLSSRLHDTRHFFSGAGLALALHKNLYQKGRGARHLGCSEK